MEVFDSIGLDIGYVLLGSIGITLFIGILCIVLMCKVHSLKKKYRSFMSGSTMESMEDEISKRFQEINNLQKETKEVENRVVRIEDTLKVVYQKVGIVKYDAFSEMGGKLSFVLALLTEENDGFLLNSMHSSREGCYTYIKEIIKGESFVILSEEEKLALKQAIESKNLHA
ncbi:Protein of unknown function [Anaerosporobacter mobilis DSM 15930]|jgi:hypothetical protein|uniref:DUF4446 domain-containing protein n=1 Tax=Anaerosporobacter mobilis DSM 15930 TaxID=1120996 RepID=A0A1M7IV17_9FIRM|nr:DUF4446 family protein [Anaerosporobacter mobilis]SHM44197.1 Protein of unknown function [Anaerosporobacter mobilis DSM 15930]